MVSVCLKSEILLTLAVICVTILDKMLVLKGLVMEYQHTVKWNTNFIRLKTFNTIFTLRDSCLTHSGCKSLHTQSL